MNNLPKVITRSEQVAALAALERAAEYAGGYARLASLLGVNRQRVQHWRTRQSVPAKHCLPIEQVTVGAVTAQELRPDIFGAPHAAPNLSSGSESRGTTVA